MPQPFDQAITFLYVTDVAACRNFYGTVLGLPLVLDQGSCAIFGVAGGRAFIGVCAARDPGGGGADRRQGGVVLSFVTDAVAAWHAHLLAAGIVPDGPPRQDPVTGIEHFFFRDPAGYLLEVQRFKDDCWPRAR